jgi:sterol 24-C-methyltransferase
MKYFSFITYSIIAFFTFISFNVNNITIYQGRTSINGVYELLSLSDNDVEKCTNAYEFMKNGTSESDTELETAHIKNYYKVLNILLSIADIEKMYIPPEINPDIGLYENQIIWEEMITETLNVGSNSNVLDIGCGRGRIAHHVATLTGGNVSGFNIDSYQIENAIKYAKSTNFEHRLEYKVSDHHKRFPYDDETFDGGYSYQAIWPFFKKKELYNVSREIFRVLKPGAIFTCSEYLLTPHFDRNNKKHMDMHNMFLPTLAATQSNYPSDITSALKRSGFKIILSAPSIAPSWPLTYKKTNVLILMKNIISMFNKIGFISPWIEILIDNLLRGGAAWTEAEKSKIADLNWRIIVQKPFI